MEKTIGILGGMGIDATAELLTKIIDATGAKREQDNLRVVIEHNPKIPDRTQAIVGGGESPLAAIKASLDVLERAGADFIAIPCNTAHHYFDEMQEHSPLQIIHIIEEAVASSLRAKGDLKSAGILATTGTVNSGLYQSRFAVRGVDVVLPDEKEQAVVMDTIMALKSREDRREAKKRLVSTARTLIQHGAELIVISCTDISAAMKDDDSDVPTVDALQALAEKAVEMARQGR